MFDIKFSFEYLFVTVSCSKKFPCTVNVFLPYTVIECVLIVPSVNNDVLVDLSFTLSL